MPIRVAIPEDAKDIGKLRVRAWQAAYKNILPDEYLRSLDPSVGIEHLKQTIRRADSGHIYTVAVSACGVVGFSIIGPPRYSAENRTIELWALNVDPDAWRSGHGRNLVNQALKDAAELGAAVIELWCMSQNRPACALYEACGFIASGRERTTSSLTGYPIHEVSYLNAF